MTVASMSSRPSPAATAWATRSVLPNMPGTRSIRAWVGARGNGTHITRLPSRAENASTTSRAVGGWGSVRA